MDLLTKGDLQALLIKPQAHCVSIFMPTHRGGSEEDPIRWRVHLGEAEERLIAAGLRAPEAKKFLAPARQLLDSANFWKNQSDGLACFLATAHPTLSEEERDKGESFRRLYRLPLAFPDLVVVGNRFQVTPLLPLFSIGGRFFVLALSQNVVRLLQGTAHRVSEVNLRGVPRSLSEALLTHDRDEPLTFHGRPTSGGTWGAIFSGQGVGIDTKKDDLLLYFQKIDRGLHAVLHEERAPLVLAAVDYLQPIYRQANTYAHLVEKGIEGNPDRLSGQELHSRAWALVQPVFEQAQKNALAQYHQLAGTGHTAGAVAEVVPAAFAGKVDTLWVAANRQCWGRFDPDARQVEEHAQPQPGDEDLLNLAAVSVLGHGRTVYAVEPAQVPDDGLMAALLHRPLPRHGKRP
jgi:hypothetical protein